MVSTYGTRRRRAKRRCAVGLDRRAVAIADGRHVQHDSLEAGEAGEAEEAEAVDENRL